jgi:hypothetical protein
LAGGAEVSVPGLPSDSNGFRQFLAVLVGPSQAAQISTFARPYTRDEVTHAGVRVLCRSRVSYQCGQKDYGNEQHLLHYQFSFESKNFGKSF